jgi:hypothetical protein
MKELLKKFENLWIAIAFAEAGEHESSQEYLVPDPSDEFEPEAFQVI